MSNNIEKIEYGAVTFKAYSSRINPLEPILYSVKQPKEQPFILFYCTCSNLVITT